MKDLKKFIATTIREYHNENYTNEIWYHGSDKVYNKPRKGNETNIDLSGFFVTKDFEYAKLHAPKTGIVYSMTLNNYNCLDLSYLDESTILKNKTIFKRQMNNNFPFQNEFEEFVFENLNKKRQNNGKTPFTLNYFQNNIVNEFRPTSNEWNIEGLGVEYLNKYIEYKKYDCILFKREMLIINMGIINNFKKAD